jgi:hypothetical protein
MRRSSGEIALLFRVQNHKPNEMLVHPVGLGGKQPVLRAEFPEQVLPRDAVPSFRYKDGIEVGVPVDHITCHQDGSFQIRTRAGHPVKYLHRVDGAAPVHPASGVILHFDVISDVVERYVPLRVPPKTPNYCALVSAGQVVTVRANFAGVQHPFRLPVPPQTSMGAVDSPTLGGVFRWQVRTPTEAELDRRPRGTIYVFEFEQNDGRRRRKAFVFE